MPAAASNQQPELLVVGSLADIVEDQLLDLLRAMGIERLVFFQLAAPTSFQPSGLTPGSYLHSHFLQTPHAPWSHEAHSIFLRLFRLVQREHGVGCGRLRRPLV